MMVLKNNFGEKLMIPVQIKIIVPEKYKDFVLSSLDIIDESVEQLLEKELKNIRKGFLRGSIEII